ncbi:hypothetical protein Bca4012_058982 [Brassica carinata]
MKNFQTYTQTAGILKPVASSGVSRTIRSMLSVKLAFEPKLVYVGKASVFDLYGVQDPKLACARYMLRFRFSGQQNGATTSDMRE